MNTKTHRHSTKLSWAAGSLLALVLGATFAAAANLGISAGLATNLYFVLQGVAWGGTVVGIVAGMGIGAFAAQLVWQAVKRYSLQTFITW